MQRMAIAAALAAFCCTSPAWALNKCTDASGSVTYQVESCPKNDKAANVKIWGEQKPLTPYRPGSVPIVPDSPKHDKPPVVPNASLSGPPEAAALLAIYRRWIDLDTLARSTARVALSGPVGKLQDMVREAQQTAVQPCANDAKEALVALISGDTKSMLAFMQNNELGAAIYDATHRDEQVTAFEGAIQDMRCAKH